MEWQAKKAADLQELADIVKASVADGRLPSTLPPNLMETAVQTSLLALGLLLILVPVTRRLIWNTIDTMLAIICLVLLMAVVLGMPFGEQGGQGERDSGGSRPGSHAARMAWLWGMCGLGSRQQRRRASQLAAPHLRRHASGVCNWRPT